MPEICEVCDEVSAGGKSDYENPVRINAEFFGVRSDVIYRRGKFGKRDRIAVRRNVVIKNESRVFAIVKLDGDGVGFAPRRKV